MINTVATVSNDDLQRAESPPCHVNLAGAGDVLTASYAPQMRLSNTMPPPAL